MPLLDSFKVDHTKMKAPGVRLAKKMITPKGDEILIFDLRFCTPNIEIMDEKGIHTLEHLIAGFMRDHLNSQNCEIIDISPMGCRTGFYMSLIGNVGENDVILALKSSLNDVINLKDESQIPELNIYQCGSYKLHSLENAKNIAKNILNKEISVLKNSDLILNL